MVRRTVKHGISLLRSIRLLCLFLVLTSSVLIIIIVTERITQKLFTSNYNNPKGIMDSEKIEAWLARHTAQNIKGITANFTAVKKFGLGNKLFELISVLGIANKLNRTAVFSNNDNNLSLIMYNVSLTYPEIFRNYKVITLPENMTTVPFNHELCCVYEDLDELRENTKYEKMIMLDGVFFQSYKYFNEMKDEVRKLLTPTVEVREKVKNQVPLGIEKQFVICTHIRRGDFNNNDTVHFPSNALFTLEATRHLYQKYLKIHPETAVFVLGDDYHWAKHLFGRDIDDLTILRDTEPEEDLYFSSQYCDVVLITAPGSTFGFWLGYLSKPESIVYYHDIRETNEGLLSKLNPDDFFPSEWIRVRMSGDVVEIH